MGLVEQIEAQLTVLHGLPLWACERLIGVQILKFGNRTNVPSRRGGVSEIGEYGFHVQCAWRLRDLHTIIAASGDRNYPKGDPDAPEGTFDLERPGATRCDERLTSFTRAMLPLVVNRVSADAIGGLRLFLGDSVVFEVFPDNSLGGEFWRLLQPSRKDTPHLVFAGGELREQ